MSEAFLESAGKDSVAKVDEMLAKQQATRRFKVVNEMAKHPEVWEDSPLNAVVPDQDVETTFYENVANQIRECIRDDIYPVRSKLLSETEMMANFGVSARGTVRSALRLLRSEGLIVTRRGKGSYVAKKPDDFFEDGIIEFNGQKFRPVQ
jgi:DNA-binding transcriptional regulator YhcF (GntR family)